MSNERDKEEEVKKKQLPLKYITICAGRRTMMHTCTYSEAQREAEVHINILTAFEGRHTLIHTLTLPEPQRDVQVHINNITFCLG